MNIDKKIELLERLLYLSVYYTSRHTPLKYDMNDDFNEYLDSIKSYKTDLGEYVIYYDESLKNKIKYDLRELKLQKIIESI